MSARWWAVFAVSTAAGVGVLMWAAVVRQLGAITETARRHADEFADE